MGEGKGKTWRWNFDGDTVGVTPQELEVILGDWVIRMDSTAPSPPHVLAQLKTFPEGIHFPRCLAKDLHFYFCPHEGGPLSDGSIEGEIVTCLWHGATFHIKSGETLEPPAGEKMGPPVDKGIACYPVRIVGTEVKIEI